MTATPLTLYNSLSRSLETFVPLDPADVRVYSCGPTVYNYAHIGNLRAYVFTDTLSRVLTWKGYPLTHIINITDVGHLTSDADAGDDKMEAAARAQSMSIWDIAAHYTTAFKQNLKDLNIREPSRFPLATDHIEEMIAFGVKIAANCYELDSGLYFDTGTVPDYGRLAGTREDDREGRIDPVAGKRNPQDFAIWRKSEPGENRQMEWDSPWGRGAPGWHLECSVMSQKYLGANFDIHTGGIDHREIHHPNEIAQNQAHCGCADTGATFWMHNNFLVERSGKMSKSGGGFRTLQSLIDLGVHPLAYRLMCLSAHYRSELEFSLENLMTALTRLKRLIGMIEKLKPDDNFDKWLEFLSGKPSFQQQLDQILPIPSYAKDCLFFFDDYMSKDLGTVGALTFLDALLGDREMPDGLKLKAVGMMDTVLGLRLTELTRHDLRLRPKSAGIDEAEIEARLAERREARAAKDFARSDAIRDELATLGVEVMDGDPLGWDWRLSL
ncbi:cysteine--tRNA ligase [Sphingomonas aliaeris]|uniref:Cysteine--tRNA ligase n=2 Tax=Sphingomonas aliaeris TaxID=2759526 RepID=A0A974S5A8_9SPHN|nr:cysteine--tRNA ligase [Sphingomonas aliaeris]QQV78492.1 cysteine--tRNA ligase [Sphingomonas aliaeris]